MVPKWCKLRPLPFLHSPPSLPTVRIYCSVYSGTLCTSVLRSSDVELERFYVENFNNDLVNSVLSLILSYLSSNFRWLTCVKPGYHFFSSVFRR